MFAARFLGSLRVQAGPQKKGTFPNKYSPPVDESEHMGAPRRASVPLWYPFQTPSVCPVIWGGKERDVGQHKVNLIVSLFKGTFVAWASREATWKPKPMLGARFETTPFSCQHEHTHKHVAHQQKGRWKWPKNILRHVQVLIVEHVDST